jgi:hypothetical protein
LFGVEFTTSTLLNTLCSDGSDLTLEIRLLPSDLDVATKITAAVTRAGSEPWTTIILWTGGTIVTSLQRAAKSQASMSAVLEGERKLSKSNYGRRCLHLAQHLELEANALKATNPDLAEKLLKASK